MALRRALFCLLVSHVLVMRAPLFFVCPLLACFVGAAEEGCWVDFFINAIILGMDRERDHAWRIVRFRRFPERVF